MKYHPVFLIVTLVLALSSMHAMDRMSTTHIRRRLLHPKIVKKINGIPMPVLIANERSREEKNTIRKEILAFATMCLSIYIPIALFLFRFELVREEIKNYKLVYPL